MGSGGPRGPHNPCKKMRGFAPQIYKFIGFGDFHGPKPYEFIRFGDIHGSTPYESIGFGGPGTRVYPAAWVRSGPGYTPVVYQGTRYTRHTGARYTPWVFEYMSFGPAGDRRFPGSGGPRESPGFVFPWLFLFIPGFWGPLKIGAFPITNS
jgi:hypothetical protein